MDNDEQFSATIRKLTNLGDKQRFALHRFLADMHFQVKYRGKKQFTVGQLHKMLHSAADKTQTDTP